MNDQHLSDAVRRNVRYTRMMTRRMSRAGRRRAVYRMRKSSKAGEFPVSDFYLTKEIANALREAWGGDA